MEIEDIMTEPWLPSRDTVEIVKSIGKQVSYKSGDLLVTQGKRSYNFIMIKEGICRSFYTDEKYEDTNLFAKDGDIIGAIGCYFSNSVARFSIEALTPVEAILISFEELRKAVAANVELSAWVRDLLFGQLNALELRYSYRSGRGDAYFRYVKLLENWPHKRINDIPLKYIAQYLQITPQMLSKLRRRYLENT